MSPVSASVASCHTGWCTAVPNLADQSAFLSAILHRTAGQWDDNLVWPASIRLISTLVDLLLCLTWRVLACSSIDRTLPFELRALEAALAHTCRSLEQESIQVERATLPSLKALMQKVSCSPCMENFQISDGPSNGFQIMVKGMVVYACYYFDLY